MRVLIKMRMSKVKKLMEGFGVDSEDRLLGKAWMELDGVVAEELTKKDVKEIWLLMEEMELELLADEEELVKRARRWVKRRGWELTEDGVMMLEDWRRRSWDEEFYRSLGVRGGGDLARKFFSRCGLIGVGVRRRV